MGKWVGMGWDFEFGNIDFHGLLFTSAQHARQQWRLLIDAVDQKSLLFPVRHHKVSLGRLSKV